MAERVGFAPRHYFSSLVFARLLLYFSHSYYFFVAITRKEIHLHSKDENGIQPFPASGSPTAGFSLSLKCERRQRVAALLYPNIFLAEAKGFAPRHCFSSLVFTRLLLYFSHSYYFIVAITPGLQTTVSSVVWSACFCCLLYRLQANFQPVRIPFRQRQSKTNRQIFACSFCLAEAKGFEPLRLLGKRFSRPPRYDHFDKLPFI